jgi:SSS family solute:Na+ symporter
VIFYTMLGGIVAVMWSDAIQALILMAGALFCLVLLLTGLPEGAAQGFQLAVAQDKFSLGSIGGSLADSTFWVVLVYGLVINLQNFGIDQNYVQRYVAARSATAARSSLWLGGLLYVPVSAVFFLIGTALFVFYSTQPGLLPTELQAEGNADRIFPYFIITQLPPGVRGLLLAAIFAAAMSTLSTSLNSSATLLLTDWYQRFLQPECTPRQSMRVLHGASLVWGLLGTGVALAMIGVKAALDVWWTLSGIFAGGMLGLFLLGLISRRAGNPSAVVGVAAGVGAILWMTLSPGSSIWPEDWQNPMHSFLTVVVGTIVILCVGLLVSSWGGRKAGVHRR